MTATTTLPPPYRRNRPHHYDDGCKSSTEVTRLTGASYRQVDYWCRTGLIPGQLAGPGSGGRRRFTPEQVDRVRFLLTASRIRNASFADLIQFVEAGGELPRPPEALTA